MASRQVVFRPEAVDDVLAVKGWYDSRRAGLGQEFGQVLDGLVERIASNPDMFRRVHGATRRAVMSRFPYAVYFRASDEHVVVLALHGRQHPSRWRSRT